MRMRLGIVGFGTVGKFLSTLFSPVADSIEVFDKYVSEFNTRGHKDRVNQCDLAFVAVPTPAADDGSADITQVREALSWIEPAVCIKSTVPPGTTRLLSNEMCKPFVVSPEYVGETPYHKYRGTHQEELVVLGGDRDYAERFARLYALALGPETKYFLTDATTAELTKYMENCFFATKLAFVGQFYLLAQQFGADFYQMREMWVSDSRIGRSHSMVIDNPGYDGRCLPKDISAIVSASKTFGGAPLLRSVMEFNSFLRAQAYEQEATPVESGDSSLGGHATNKDR
jgi:UDPglucose 6-dehydrogenase